MPVAAVADMGDLGADLVELARHPAQEGTAGRVLAGEAPGQRLDLAAGHVEPLGDAARCFGAGFLERRPALLDHRQRRLALRLEAGAGHVDRFGALASSRRPRLPLLRGLVHPLGGGAGAAFDARDMGAEPLRGAACDLVRLAALGGQSGELALERTRLLMGGEARLLHRLGGGAGLRLGLGQVRQQHADVDPRRLGGQIQRLRLAFELGALAEEDRGDAADRSTSSPRLISRAASSFSAARLSAIRAVTWASTFSNAWLSCRIAITCSVKRAVSRRELRPNTSQPRPIRTSGALNVPAQPIQAGRLGPGQAKVSA